MKNKNIKRVSFIILLIFTILWMLPLVWSIATSFKTSSDIANNPISLIPKEITIENYSVLFKKDDTPVLRWMLNSFVVASVHTFIYIIIASLAAFAFSKLEFKFRDQLFWILLATTMIPGVVNLVPLLTMTISFGWLGSWLALIVPGLGGVFGLFLMRQFFMGIPNELIESAKIDGLSTFGIYLKIILPLSKSAIMVAAIFSFMGSWNDYLWPQLAMAGSDVKNLTLPIGLSLISSTYNYNYGLSMAAAVLSTIPVLIVYIFLQRYIIEGVSRTGIK